MPTVRLRAGSALLFVLVGAGVAGVWRRDAATQAERQEAIETSRVRAWARSEGGAGVSVIPKRIPAADGKELRRLDTLPGYHAYALRCSSCHVLPDPAAYRPRQWIGKVDGMREHMIRAGVVPPSESELDAARTFLRAASEVLRAR